MSSVTANNTSVSNETVSGVKETSTSSTSINQPISENEKELDKEVNTELKEENIVTEDVAAEQDKESETGFETEVSEPITEMIETTENINDYSDIIGEETDYVTDEPDYTDYTSEIQELDETSKDIDVVGETNQKTTEDKTVNINSEINKTKENNKTSINTPHVTEENPINTTKLEVIIDQSPSTPTNETNIESETTPKTVAEKTSANKTIPVLTSTSAPVTNISSLNSTETKDNEKTETSIEPSISSGEPQIIIAQEYDPNKLNDKVNKGEEEQVNKAEVEVVTAFVLDIDGNNTFKTPPSIRTTTPTMIVTSESPKATGGSNLNTNQTQSNQTTINNGDSSIGHSDNKTNIVLNFEDIINTSADLGTMVVNNTFIVPQLANKTEVNPINGSITVPTKSHDVNNNTITATTSTISTTSTEPTQSPTRDPNREPCLESK